MMKVKIDNLVELDSSKPINLEQFEFLKTDSGVEYFAEKTIPSQVGHYQYINFFSKELVYVYNQNLNIVYTCKKNSSYSIGFRTNDNIYILSSKQCEHTFTSYKMFDQKQLIYDRMIGIYKANISDSIKLFYTVKRGIEAKKVRVIFLESQADKEIVFPLRDERVSLESNVFDLYLSDRFSMQGSLFLEDISGESIIDEVDQTINKILDLYDVSKLEVEYIGVGLTNHTVDVYSEKFGYQNVKHIDDTAYSEVQLEKYRSFKKVN